MKHILLIFLVLLSTSVKAQQIDVVDFETIDAQIGFDDDTGRVYGLVQVGFLIKQETDSIYLDAKNMNIEFMSVFKITPKQIATQVSDFSNNGERFVVYNSFKKNIKYKLLYKYEAFPKKALYSVNRDSTNQIWTQGQGKYTSNWLPSIDDANDKIEFDIAVTYKNDYTVLANGILKDKVVGEKTTKWYYDMQQPMSSYLVALAIGNYHKKEEVSKSGIPLEYYYYPEDSAKVEPTYRYTKQMFDFLEQEIGVPYPWQNYKQVPVKDFLYSGMENTSLTIFSDDFLIDSIAFTDKNYVNVNAHELAHQWFGDLVTAKSGEHHWLQEGFATYYALLAEKQLFGQEYYNWKLYDYAQELLQQDQAGNSTALLNPKSSSVTFYKKGAWVLHLLKDKVGEKAFKKAVKQYLKKYKFKNVETKNFINEVEEVSGENLKEFVTKWLEQEALPYQDLLSNLMKHSSEIKQKIELDKTLQTSSLTKATSLNNYWNKATSSKVKQWFINENANVLPENIIKEAVNSSNIMVRQAVAKNVNEIPSALKKDYERLLSDQSYVTKELALLNLWTNFPENRIAYLEQTKGEVGFNDKNVRTLWLTLALVTPDFNTLKKETYYNELVNYTSPKHSFTLRQNAFIYLANINAFNKLALDNLVDASKHHNWRFKSFAKNLIEKLSENENYKQLVEQIINSKK